MRQDELKAYRVIYKMSAGEAKTHTAIQFHTNEEDAREHGQAFIRGNGYPEAVVIHVEETADPSAEAPLEERGELYLVTYTAQGHAAGLYPFHIDTVEREIARGVDWLRNPTPGAWVAVGLAPSMGEAMAIVDGLSEELERLGRPIRVVAP